MRKDGRMIRTSPDTIRRAAAVLLAVAALPFLTANASAQTLDLFAGAIPNTPGDPATLSVTSAAAINSTTSSASGLFGVTGYSGTVSLTTAVINTVGEGFALNNGANVFTIAQNGGVATSINTSAAKSFGTQLAVNTTYLFTLTKSAGSTVSALGSFNIALDNGGTTFVNTATGQGLVGTVNVLSLFGNTGAATFNFTTPANYVPANGLGVTFSSSLPASALGTSFTFTGASITQVVPEPATAAAMLLGAGGLVTLRFRRRLAAV